MLFIFYLGLWNSQIITMKTISPMAKFSICWWKCSPRAWALLQHMLFMSSCNLLVLKESKKKLWRLFSSGIRVRNCNDGFVSLSGLYPAEKCSQATSYTAVWPLVSRKTTVLFALISLQDQFLITDFTELCLQQGKAGNCFILHWKEKEEG